MIKKAISCLFQSYLITCLLMLGTLQLKFPYDYLPGYSMRSLAQACEFTYLDTVPKQRDVAFKTRHKVSYTMDLG